mmetsp:Transcript_13403/g.27905  ORF Transcript_13403/g.27905 Transcript_13403/m.27905 type:complete len:346 (-) Transcript_13403:177-1214(-)
MCFLIGATGLGVTASGEALLGCVSDDPYLFRTFVRMVQPPAGHAHVGTELAYATDCSDLEPPFKVEPGEPSRGVNSAGLAFVVALAVERANHSAGAAEQPVPFADLSRRMMAECSSVDDALALLQSAPAVSPAFSVLLADASGNLAQVEVGAFGTAIHQRLSREKPGVVLAVNCYQSKELKGLNDPAAELGAPENNNGCRLSRGQELADAWRGRLDVAAFRSILSDHGNRDRDPAENPLLRWWGYSICNHGTRRRESYDSGAAPWGTVSAEVLQPSLRALHYNYGWACGEHAEFADQLFQSKSWSKFATFVSAVDGVLAARSIPCTTVQGEMTADGRAFQLQVSA